jgi:hypothetical protein
MLKFAAAACWIGRKLGENAETKLDHRLLGLLAVFAV